MKKPSAIIIEGHVQGLSNLRSLGELGETVWVVDKRSCIAAKSKYCARFLKCPDFITYEFVDFLLKLGEQEQLENCLLIPSNDHAVINLARHKDALFAYYTFVLPDIETLENVYDKSKLLEIAKQCGVPIPTTQYFKHANDNVHRAMKFPVLTKGKNGLSFYKALGKKAFLADNASQLTDQLLEIEKKIPLVDTFSQELIPFDGTNKTISFTAFCEHGVIRTHWAGVKLREHPIQFGTATYAKSIFSETCLSQSAKLLKTLNFTGVCEVEYLLDPRTQEYKLIEINARTWLWVGLAKASGVDYAKLLFAHANKQAINFPEKYALGVTWFNPISDFIYASISILKGKEPLGKYLKFLISKSKYNALFTKGDRSPGFAYVLNLFSFFKNR